MQWESVTHLKIKDLVDFEAQPFKVVDDEAMQEPADSIKTVVVKLNDDEATILFVDSNLQREKLLPSEHAYAYKLKLEALKHQGIKNEFTC